MGLVVVVIMSIAGCTKKNADFCCTTIEDCNALGVDELRSCPAD